MRTKLLVMVLFTAFSPLQATAETHLPAAVSDQDFIETDPAQVALGRLLFWDPILSGNRNISCGTCHHPRFGTSDGVSLSLGDGGIGVGPQRRPDPENLPEQRIPRNSPALFNLGAKEFTVLFHDGRIEVSPGKKDGIRTPLDAEMVEGFSNVLSAQTMFPVLSPDEMAGHYSENEISKAVRIGLITGEGGAWDLISNRVAAIPEYRDMFGRAFPDASEGAEIDFTRISDAIAAFIAFEWRADDSEFDRYLRGTEALDETQSAGMALFYGVAGCSNCHSGPFQTDHDFHAMGAPQIGPGKAARFESHARDEGRFRVTGRSEDLFAFRTPSLRNVIATAPYGHAGAHADLADFLRHHVDPKGEGYDLASAVLPALPGADDRRILSDPTEIASIEASVTGTRLSLSDDEILEIVSFLHALTDNTARAGRLGIPETVPSKLPVDR